MSRRKPLTPKGEPMKALREALQCVTAATTVIIETQNNAAHRVGEATLLAADDRSKLPEAMMLASKLNGQTELAGELLDPLLKAKQAINEAIDEARQLRETEEVWYDPDDPGPPLARHVLKADLIGGAPADHVPLFDRHGAERESVPRWKAQQMAGYTVEPTEKDVPDEHPCGAVSAYECNCEATEPGDTGILKEGDEVSIGGTKATVVSSDSPSPGIHVHQMEFGSTPDPATVGGPASSANLSEPPMPAGWEIPEAWSSEVTVRVKKDGDVICRRQFWMRPYTCHPNEQWFHFAPKAGPTNEINEMLCRHDLCTILVDLPIGRAAQRFPAEVRGMDNRTGAMKAVVTGPHRPAEAMYGETRPSTRPE